MAQMMPKFWFRVSQKCEILVQISISCIAKLEGNFAKHEIENSRKLLKITKPKIFAATLGSVCHTKIWWGEGEKNVLIICKSLHTSSWQDPLNVYRSKLNYCTFSVSDEHAPQCFLSVRFSHFFSVKYSLFNMNEATVDNKKIFKNTYTYIYCVSQYQTALQ